MMFSYVLPYFLLHFNWPTSSACNFDANVKNIAAISLVLKNIIPDATPPNFQEVCGVTQSLIFCQRHKMFSSYCVNYHKID